MKNRLFIVLILCLIFILTAGCSAEKSPGKGSNAEASEIDIDLLELGYMMAYAQFMDMIDKPNNYLGKTVRVKGPYGYYYSETTDMYYHYVMIMDNAACCLLNVEFILNGDHIYPDDYPEDDTEIEVTGIFESFERAGFTIYYLAVDEIIVF